MDIDRQLKTENLLLEDRMCRSCGGQKNLLSDFYLSRSNNPELPSSYSYECKECARKRIKNYYFKEEVLGTCRICKGQELKLINDICKSCNRALKTFDYSLDSLKNAVLYLEETKN